VVASGRARWKIENENNNTLKTKGYHFEHNFGHGQQFLSSWLTTLILLAYLLPTLLDLMDGKFGLFRQKLPSRKRLFHAYPVSPQAYYILCIPDLMRPCMFRFDPSQNSGEARRHCTMSRSQL
jgi:hypothetical protein